MGRTRWVREWEKWDLIHCAAYWDDQLVYSVDDRYHDLLQGVLIPKRNPMRTYSLSTSLPSRANLSFTLDPLRANSKRLSQIIMICVPSVPDAYKHVQPVASLSKGHDKPRVIQQILSE